MNKDRLGTFSDAVIAIAMTIMVLELKPPHDASLSALTALWPVFYSYVLSFTYVAIYWNNHHHLVHTTDNVDGRILWANMVLLFWLSLIPFTTAWMGENHFQPWPTAAYGFVLLMAALSYALLQKTIKVRQEKNELLARAVGRDIKGKLSPILYLAAMGLAFVSPVAAGAIYVGVALMWLIPDRRIERKIEDA